ncbi:MAG: transcriptional regulator [Oscillospiraceae bacterium]|nr:transcriptional regulator [Oscillospiraceae bacterium]
MSSGTTKVDKAWERLFDKYNIISQVDTEGSFRISSTQINEFHEARLMAKFDQSAQLPNIFRANQLSILPVTRGDYLIGSFVTHEKINYCPSVRSKPVTDPQLETLNKENLYSEAAALFFAYNSGIIADVMGSNKINFTVNGRMGSGNFSFAIKNRLNPQVSVEVDVKNSQIEIDAGFESPEAFVICEAKNQASEEILIRQLYYPYRRWCDKITKPIIPMFLAFSNDIFHVFTYEFTDKHNYNSLTLKDYREYTFADEDVSLQDIIELWHSTTVITEPSITFPQADSFPRVLDLLSVLHEEELTRSEVTLKYEFDPRQTNYYVSACEYLGLVERFLTGGNERGYRLTSEARNVMSFPYKRKHLALMKKILERSVFNKAFDIFISSNEIPDKNAVCQVMKSTNFPIPINDTTVERRSSTVLGWVKWMLDISIAE